MVKHWILSLEVGLEPGQGWACMESQSLEGWGKRIMVQAVLELELSAVCAIWGEVGNCRTLELMSVLCVAAT